MNIGWTQWTSNSAVLEPDLEPIPMRVSRKATVVVSVRLDRTTGRRLLALAKARGQRLSDVLRAAAESYR